MKEYERFFHGRHRRVIERHLTGEEVSHNQLWLSVGYFLHGTGRHTDQSFATPEQWEKLAKETGR